MVYTSYWGNLKNLVRMFGKDNVISVSRWTKFWNGKRCSQLFPTETLLKDYKNGKVNEDEYYDIYMSMLEKMNVDNCYKVFNGKVLVCYEKEGFCHRHIIKDWLNKYGYECEEVE